MLRRFASSKPERRAISRRASRIIETQLATMARVRAISIMISPKRTLFRFMARRIGPNSRAGAAAVVLNAASYCSFKCMAGGTRHTRQAG